MNGILSDLRFALRTLRRSPLFAVIAILSFALGIGANTAIFTLLDQVILRLLPVKDAEQLVMIATPGPHMGNNRGSFANSYPMYQDFQQKAEAFSYVFCQFSTPLSISAGGQTERVNAELVSGNYFQALGVQPAAGRVFSPDQDDRQYKGHPVAVLSFDYWVNRFAADPKVIGTKILVNNYPMTVVGVSGAGFTGMDQAQSPQIRLPIQMKPLLTPGWDALGDRRSKWIQMFARLKPGYTAESSQASLQPLFQQILQYETTLPAFRKVSEYNRNRFLKRKVEVTPAVHGHSDLRRNYSTALIVLMGMVGLVLVIACTNVANLLIARALARRKEIAVRLAIGASRTQLIRQLLMESTILSLAGGVLGIFLSVWTISGLLQMLPNGGSPLMLHAEPDLRILLFNLALAFATGLGFGLIPAIQSTRFAMWDTLKNVTGAITGAGGSVKLRKALVVAQVALSFLLLAGSGLFVKSLANLKRANTGFGQIDNLITFQVEPSLNGYSVERVADFNRLLLDRIRAVPGVKRSAFASVALLHGWEWDSTMSVEGHRAADGEDMSAFMNSLSPGYFATLGIPIIEGRDIEDRDMVKPARVALVNRKFAEHYFPGRSPIGRHVGFGGGPDAKLDIEIIGMVENTLYEGPREGIHRQVFIPNYGPQSTAFYVRAGIDSKSLYTALQREVKSLDNAMPVFEMKTLENQLDEQLSTERLIAALSAAFGVLATVLAAVGLYGVMAFAVATRTKELGLRLALGAQPSMVLWLVIREVLIVLAMGLAVGVPVTLALSTYVSSQLFNVKPADAPTGFLAVTILAIVSLLAGLLPARRASTVDPITALRYE